MFVNQTPVCIVGSVKWVRKEKLGDSSARVRNNLLEANVKVILVRVSDQIISSTLSSEEEKAPSSLKACMQYFVEFLISYLFINLSQY